MIVIYSCWRVRDYCFVHLMPLESCGIISVKSLGTEVSSLWEQFKKKRLSLQLCSIKAALTLSSISKVNVG